jgi:FkbM family methyltransferase
MSVLKSFIAHFIVWMLNWPPSRWILTKLPRSAASLPFRPFRLGDLQMKGDSFDRGIAILSWKWNLFEAYERALFSRVLRPGMVVVDIGANIGLYTLIAAEKVGREGRVIAYEPDPSNFQNLLSNLKLNGFDHVDARPKAVADQSRSLRLYLSQLHRGLHQIHPFEGEARYVDVPGVSLDEDLKEIEKVNVIKMDVQGAECLALQGMQGLLSRSPNVCIFCEFWLEGIQKSGCDPKQFMVILENLGLHVYQIHESQREIRLIPKDSLFHSAPRELNLLMTRDPNLISQLV